MSRKILVLGEGAFAGKMADNLAAADLVPIFARELSLCRGAKGAYRVKARSNGRLFVDTVYGIVLAHESIPRARAGISNFLPGPGVVSLSLALKEPQLLHTARTVAFFCGIEKETGPVTMGRVMETALFLQADKKIRVFVFTGNLKVAGEGLERLYRKTKTAGVFWAKFTEKLPLVRQDEKGKIVVSFDDEISGLPFVLAPDMAVVADKWTPPPDLESDAAVLKLHFGADGRPQTDNVRRAVVETNRGGVWVAGPARRRQSESADSRDADNAVLAVKTSLATPEESTAGKADINQGLCVRCLTCYRLCPHKAVALIEERVRVAPEACLRCGVCMAECPRGAILVPDLACGKMEGLSDTPGKSFPKITLFCCERSAGRALATAKVLGGFSSENLNTVFLPCAGGLSLTDVTEAFSKGAQGVLVLTCHPGNCNSETGAFLAKLRFLELKNRLVALGLDPRRFRVESLAANMAAGFSGLIHEFRAQLGD